MNEEFDGLRVEIDGPNPLPRTARHGLIVVGSHRSGTSALARVLSLVGCDLPKRVMPPLEGSNELGFWEPETVVEAHEEFLAAIGSSWDDVASLPDGAFVSGAAARLRQQLSLLLRDEYGTSELFLVKDPRISRLLPLWYAVLAELRVAPATAIAVRNPLEVAASLKARDGFTTTKSLLLWLRHVLESEQHSRDYPRSIVMYDELLRDWHGVVTRVGEELGLTWPGRSHRAAVEVENFLSGQHRHHVFDWSDLEGRGDVVSWVKEAYFALRASNPVSVFDQVRNELSQADIAFGPVVEEAQSALQVTKEQLLKATAARDALATEVQARSATLDARLSEIRQLQGEVGRLTTEVAASDERATGREVEVDALRAQRDGFAHEVEVLAGELDRLANAVERAQSRATAAEGEAARAGEELRAARAEEERLRGAAESARSRSAALEAEMSAEREELLIRLERVRAEAEQLGRQLTTANAELGAFEARARTERGQLLQRLRETRAEAEQLAGRLSSAESKAAADRRKILSDLDAATTGARSLAKQLDDKVREANELELATDELLSVADAELKASQTERERLQAQVGDALEEQGQLLVLVERLEEAAVTAATEAASRRAEFDAQRGKLLADLEAARAETETAVSELEVVHAQLQTLKTEAASEREALIHERDTARAERERLLTKLEATRNNAEQFSARAAELEAALETERTLLHGLQSVTKRRNLRRRSLFQLGSWLLLPTPRKLNYVRRYLFLHWSGEFDADSYLLANPDVLVAGINPLMHYVEYGRGEGRQPFGSDSDIIADAAPQSSADPGVELAESFATEVAPTAEADAVASEAGFDGAEPSTAPATMLTDDVRASLEAEFDRDYYVGVHEDIERSGIDPLEHYFYTGWREGRDPSAHFSTSYYLSTNPDVAAQELNPLLHYVLTGQQEGRRPYPPTGFKRQALAKLRPLEDEIAHWQEGTGAPSPAMTSASLASRLASLIGTRRHVVVSCSHDNYTKVVGGIQLCVALEQAAFSERNCAYVNLHPVRPLPILSRETTTRSVGLSVLCDGEEIGVASGDAVIAALADVGFDKGLDFGLVVHALHGHSPEVIAELYSGLDPRWAWLWLHDYFGICPSATLLRNKVEPCGAPHPDSPGCMICIFGEERIRHVARFRSLLDRVPFKLVAPSQFMADRWKLYFGSDKLEIAVHENGILNGVPLEAGDAGLSRAIDRGPARVAFLGVPAVHKGWGVFLELVRRNAASDRYRFYHFGDGRYHAPDVERREVSVVRDGPLASVDALRSEAVDIAVLWSLWEESFSFTAHEALSAGAAIVTNKGSGNIAHMVETSGKGVVLSSEHELFEAFENDSILDLVRSRRADRLGSESFVHSRMTADFASFDA